MPSSDSRAELLILARGLIDAVNANPQVGEQLTGQFVTLARQRRDPELLSLSLRALAWAYRARLDIESARRMLDEAVQVGHRHNFPVAEGLARVSRAIVLQELGRVAAARRDLDAALEAGGSISDREPAIADSIVENVLFQRAVIEQNAGNLTLAQERYEQLLQRSGVDEGLAVKALNNVALIQARRGLHLSAQRSCEDALRRASSMGPLLRAPFMVTRAWVAAQAGRLAESLRYFDDAAALYDQTGLSRAEHYAEYADAMTDLRLLPEAARAAQRAVDGFDLAGASLLAAEARLRVARIALLSGRYAVADEAASVAGALLHRQSRSGWRDRAVVVGVESRLLAGTIGSRDLAASLRAAKNLERGGDLPSAIEANLVAGRIAIEKGRAAKALEPLERAATLARTGPVLVRIRGRLAGALAARAGGDDRGVLIECRAGLRDLAAHRSRLPTMELRALASGHGAELGEIGLGAVTRQGAAFRVLQWMERTRAAALMAIDAGPTDGFRQLREAHRTAEETREHVLRGGPDGAASPTSRGSIPVLGVGAPEEQEHRLRSATWTSQEPGAQVAAAIPSSSDLRALLAGRTLVEFGRLEGRVVAVVVGPSRARLVELVEESAVAEHVRALFFALRRLANPRSAAAAAAARASADLRVARLRDLLLRPLGVDACAELVLVPVGPLHGVPWSALHEGPIAVAPSATFWARTRRAALQRPFTAAGTDDSTTVLIAGPQLVGAAEEVEALRAVHPDARVLGPAESLSDSVIDALRTAELGHLACHGWLRADNPMFSALVLADGPVTVQELHSAGVAPHRLVLASCHSGADVAYAGDEVIGFVSAVLAQGTAGVVASIAAIPDVAAVDLMLGLHRGIAEGLTLARALHQARASIDRDTPEGYVNWCTFSAHGAA